MNKSINSGLLSQRYSKGTEKTLNSNLSSLKKSNYYSTISPGSVPSPGTLFVTLNPQKSNSSGFHARINKLLEDCCWMGQDLNAQLYSIKKTRDQFRIASQQLLKEANQIEFYFSPQLELLDHLLSEEKVINAQKNEDITVDFSLMSQQLKIMKQKTNQLLVRIKKIEDCLGCCRND